MLDLDTQQKIIFMVMNRGEVPRPDSQIVALNLKVEFH